MGGAGAIKYPLNFSFSTEYINPLARLTFFKRTKDMNQEI